MPIPLFEDIPSVLDPDNFNPKMEKLVGNLNPWTQALNETGSAFALGMRGSSTSSLSLEEGEQSLMVEPNLGYTPGMDLVVAYTTVPTMRMLGTVTSYNVATGALVVAVYSAVGTGTYAEWSISMTAAVDPAQFVTPGGNQTLTDKTIDLSNNTLLATSAQLAAAITDETGSGPLVFATAPSLVSPELTGTPTSPTAAAGTNTTQIATTAFVSTAVANLVASSPAALDTLDELAAALGDDTNFATNITNALAAKASLASPAFIGGPTAPTPAEGTNNIQIATTAFVRAEMVSGKATFTASGAIAVGDVVVLNSDETISTVGSTTNAGAMGSEQVQVASSVLYYDKVLPIPGTDKIVVMYSDYVAVGTVDPVAGTVTMGTPVPFPYSDSARMAWHEGEGKLVIGFISSSMYLVIGTITGTSLSLGTAVAGGTASVPSTYGMAMVYNQHQNKIIFGYCVGSTVISIRSATISGETVTWNTAINIAVSLTAPFVCGLQEKAGTPYLLLTTYDNGYKAKAWVVEANGASMYVGTGVQIVASAAYFDTLAYDQTNDRFILCATNSTTWYLASTAARVVSMLGSVSVSSTFYYGAFSACWDAGKGKVLICGKDVAQYGIAALCYVSGSTLVIGDLVYFNSSQTQYPTCGYSGYTDRAVIAYQDGGNSFYGMTRVVDTGEIVTNADKWIGIANAAIANGAQGLVTIRGGICSALSGLTTGMTYYIDDYGDLGQAGSRICGVALASNKLLVLGNAL